MDYDGEAHTVTGYTATASTALYDVEHDFTFSGTASAARTDAGTTNMGLAASQFANTNDNFTTVTFNVTDGYQTISPATINPSVSLENWHVGQTANSPSVYGNTGNGTVTYSYKLSTAEDAEYSSEQPTAAGTYTVKAEIAATTNYQSATTTAEFTIEGHTPAAAVIENRVEATCTEAGSYDSVVCCSVCNAELSRETVVIPATGHDWGAPTYVWSADNSSVTATRVCGNNAEHVETETVNATSEVTTAATCTEAGVLTWTSAAFENEAFAVQTTTEVIPATGHSASEAVIENRVEATCTEAGSYESVVYCMDCGVELSRETIAIPATGHAYGTPTYVWSADNSSVTATRVCGNDAEHVETETVAATSEVTTAATCTEAGVLTWTSAAFVNEAFAVQTTTEEIPATGHSAGTAVEENRVEATCTEAGHYDSVVYCTDCGAELSRETVVVAALGHDYELTGWSWSGYESATATFTCTHDSTHVESVTAEGEAITSAVTTEPTCTAEGVRTYTATVTFLDTEYSNSTTEAIPMQSNVFVDRNLEQAEETQQSGIYTVNVGSVSSPVEAIITVIDSNQFKVECEKACVIAYSTDNGVSWSEIKATVVNGEYVFDMPNVNIDFMIAVALNGDADLNGIVNSSDAMRINRYAVGLTTNNAKLSGLGLIAADADGNQIVNSSDAMRINRYSVGLTTNNARISWHTI